MNHYCMHVQVMYICMYTYNYAGVDPNSGEGEKRPKETRRGQKKGSAIIPISIIMIILKFSPPQRLVALKTEQLSAFERIVLLYVCETLTCRATHD